MSTQHRVNVLARLCDGISDDMFDQYVKVLTAMRALHPPSIDDPPLGFTKGLWSALSPSMKRALVSERKRLDAMLNSPFGSI